MKIYADLRYVLRHTNAIKHGWMYLGEDLYVYKYGWMDRWISNICNLYSLLLLWTMLQSTYVFQVRFPQILIFMLASLHFPLSSGFGEQYSFVLKGSAAVGGEAHRLIAYERK